MKKNMKPALVPIEPTEADIRAYAFHLYEQNGRIPGRDMENWLEAKACILANIPPHSAHVRLHRHLHHQQSNFRKLAAFTVPNPEAHNLAS